MLYVIHKCIACPFGFCTVSEAGLPGVLTTPYLLQLALEALETTAAAEQNILQLLKLMGSTVSGRR